MRTILHVIDTTGPGGAETIFTQIIQHSVEKGYRAVALIRGEGWVSSQLERLNTKVIIENSKGSFNVTYLRKLIQIIKDENVDLIQTHLLGSAIYCSAAAIITRKPVISTMHGLVDISPNEKFRFLKLLFLRFGVRRFIAVTDALSDYLSQLPMISKSKIETIYNGIDTSKFVKQKDLNFRESLGVTNDDFLIGSLGNIRKPKNYILAIHVIRYLHDKGFPVHYAIAGDGSEEQMRPIKTLCEKSGLTEFVHLLGFYKNTQQFLSSLDLFLMSSTSEGHPLALTQAMVNGLPIATTKSGVELIVTHEQEAMISDVMTPESLGDCILKLIRDDSLAVRLSETARNKATQLYSLQAMLDKYSNLYKEYLT